MKFKQFNRQKEINYLSVEIVWTLNMNADIIDLFTVV